MLKHELIPIHTKISDDEKKVLLEKYTTMVQNLPKISRKDPAIAHLDVKYGDIIKIERLSQTAGSSVYYRGVTDE